jgi:hypothetical protein
MPDPLTLSDLDRLDEASAHRHSVHNGSGLTLDRGTLESLLSMAREALLARDARPTQDGRDGGGCDIFSRGTPGGDCAGDGHYECKECVSYRRQT